MHDCEKYLEQYHAYSTDTLKTAEPEGRPMDELQTIAELYLPELDREVTMLFLAFHNRVVAGINLRRELDKMGAVDDADKLALYAKVLDEYHDVVRRPEMLDAVGALRAAAHTLLMNIMDVDEQPAEFTQREGAPIDER
jgi:hypothetical protein